MLLISCSYHLGIHCSLTCQWLSTISSCNSAGEPCQVGSILSLYRTGQELTLLEAASPVMEEGWWINNPVPLPSGGTTLSWVLYSLPDLPSGAEPLSFTMIICSQTLCLDFLSFLVSLPPLLLPPRWPLKIPTLKFLSRSVILGESN